MCKNQIKIKTFVNVSNDKIILNFDSKNVSIYSMFQALFYRYRNKRDCCNF